MASDRVVFDIDAPPGSVWQVTGERWDDIARIVPSISNSELLDGPEVGVGAARRCTLREPTFGMAFVEERLVAWDPPRSFTYEMIEPPFPLRRLGNTWTVEERGGGTRLTMEPFAELKARPVTKWLEGFVLRRMIDSLESDREETRAAIERAADDVR